MSATADAGSAAATAAAAASSQQDPSVYAANGRLHAGRMMHQCATAEAMPVQSWSNVSGTTFETRIGPGYQSNKRKDASKPCIYECAAVDVYTADVKVSHVGRFVDLPGDHLDDTGNDGYLPATFIVNFQIPNYPVENAIWGQCAGEGPGYSIVFYFTLSAYGREQVARRGPLESSVDALDSQFHGSLLNTEPTPRHPTHSSSGSASFSSMFSLASTSTSAAAGTNSATTAATAAPATIYSSTDPNCFRSRAEPCNSAMRLLHHFVDAPEGSDLRQRFKAIMRMMNIDQVGLSTAPRKLISHYNSTPFLIRTCSVFHRGERYFEVDVDVHRFSYTARLGLGGVRERIKDVVFDFGFVIEGHSDFELPENMLGAVRVSKLDLTLAKPFPFPQTNGAATQ